ncbi:hypothetical protein K525DRAFT_262196, partial [Schizophyllum commune Loenen D]
MMGARSSIRARSFIQTQISTPQLPPHIFITAAYASFNGLLFMSFAVTFRRILVAPSLCTH